MLGPPPLAASGRRLSLLQPGPIELFPADPAGNPSPIRCLGSRTPPRGCARQGTPAEHGEVACRRQACWLLQGEFLSLVPCAAHPSLMGTDLQMGSWGCVSSILFSLLPPPAPNHSTLLSPLEHSGECLVVTCPASAQTGTDRDASLEGSREVQVLAEPLNARLDNHERCRETCGLHEWCKCHQPKELGVCVCDVSLSGEVTKQVQLCCWFACRVSESRAGWRVPPQPQFWAPVMTMSLGMHVCVDPPPVPPSGMHPPQPSSSEPWMGCCSPAPPPCPPHPSVRAGPPRGLPSPAGLREAPRLPLSLQQPFPSS